MPPKKTKAQREAEERAAAQAAALERALEGVPANVADEVRHRQYELAALPSNATFRNRAAIKAKCK